MQPWTRALILLFAALFALAQSQTKSNDLGLRGDRFKPLTADQLTPEQKTMVDHLLKGERAGLNGPFNVLLRSPEMGDLAQQFGASMRFHSSIPKKLNEFAIILTARFWGAEYEWYAHKRAALMAGMEQPIVDAVTANRRPSGMDKDEEIVYNFCTDVLKNHQVSDAVFKATRDRFGEKGVVDLMGVMGWYNFVSMMLNVDRYPLPEGAKPELH
jgi:4-carboxymuconolactone decarboxylase